VEGEPLRMDHTMYQNFGDVAAQEGFPDTRRPSGRSPRWSTSTSPGTRPGGARQERHPLSSVAKTVTWHCRNCGLYRQGKEPRNPALPASIQAYYEVLAENYR